MPLHFTKATIFSLLPASTPIMAAIFSAQGAPPTGQASTGAVPSAMAFARPSQPGKPQPPQLLPGSSSLTNISFSSTSTAKFLSCYSQEHSDKEAYTAYQNRRNYNSCNHISRLLRLCRRSQRKQWPSDRLSTVPWEIPGNISEYHCIPSSHADPP